MSFSSRLLPLLKNEKTKDYIENCLQQVNNNKELLEKIANEQVYELCEWQKTDYQINFRRFFTVNGLICLNMQNSEVFQHYHKYIKYLLDQGVFQGLRIDHVDGLYDPTAYLQQLRELAGEETYIVVEKILEQGEALPEYWPVQGNTGYDFLSMVNNVFTQKNSEEQFTDFYTKLVSDNRSIHEQLHDKKSYILHENMGGELDNLHQLFVEMDLIEKDHLEKVPAELLKDAIAEFLIYCPVYRYYGNRLPLQEKEEHDLLDIFISIRNLKAELAPAIELLKEALLIKPKESNAGYNTRALRFYQRCMQFTGPLMAKGVEGHTYVYL
jgi:maltooligosyltrehalose synthase